MCGMKKWVIALTVAVASCSSGTFAAPVRIDVAPGGSLSAARDRVRALAAADRAKGVEVVLAPGEYFLPDGLDFAAEDGGASAAAPVVWRAEKPGTAQIVGTRRIPASSFARVTDPAILAQVPEEGRGRVYAADVSAFCPEKVPDFSMRGFGLGYVPDPPVAFICGRVGLVAQWPNGADSWETFSVRVDQGRQDGKRQSIFRGGAFVCTNPRLKLWDFTKGVWLGGYFTHDWATRAAPAVSWGAENGTNDVVRFSPDAEIVYGVMSGTWGRKERRFRAFNLLEELDDPGEWWLDRAKKVLYVVPPDGEMRPDADIRLAFSTKAMVRGGNVSNIRFEGLSFRANCGSLFSFVRSSGVTLSGCSFSCAIDAAVSIEGTGNRVSGCEVFECGSSGILMSGGSRRTLAPSGSAVENCRIHDYGIYQRTYSMGVRLEGCGLALRGCEIFGAPHMAMRYEANDCMIESNDVHHVLRETGDAGAFYTGRDWTTQGNVLRHNFIHDIGTGTTLKEGEDAAVSGTNAMALYFDDCDCGDEVYGNVFLNVPRGILLGGGRDHPIRNNLFINCRLGMSIDCRGYRWKNYRLPGPNGRLKLEAVALRVGYTNDVWKARYPRLENIMDDHPIEPLHNPIEGNVFIDCGESLKMGEIIKYNDNGSLPGILSRMAPIRNNTIIHTKGAGRAKREELDPRIAGGFRVLDGTGMENR